MNITLNGKPYTVPRPMTIAELAAHLSLVPAQVAIERNRAIVPRSTYANVALSEDDDIEIVGFIGGG